jgi:hypothetical protein
LYRGQEPGNIFRVYELGGLSFLGQFLGSLEWITFDITPFNRINAVLAAISDPLMVEAKSMR